MQYIIQNCSTISLSGGHLPKRGEMTDVRHNMFNGRGGEGRGGVSSVTGYGIEYGTRRNS